MNIQNIYSYRFAEEIIQHERHLNCWSEIQNIVSNAPLFIHPRKSRSNQNLDVVQQLMNTYCDRIFSVENKWKYHPLATGIEGSRLAADYKKRFNDLTIQAEVQFGNMARWYSDIFKFQAAYSQGLIDIGLCIVPKALASRIDSNITNFERIRRELPYAKLSITLPILVIGIEPDRLTEEVNVENCAISLPDITGKNKAINRFRIVNGYLNGIAMEEINEEYETGPLPNEEIQEAETFDD